MLDQYEHLVQPLGCGAVLCARPGLCDRDDIETPSLEDA